MTRMRHWEFNFQKNINISQQFPKTHKFTEFIAVLLCDREHAVKELMFSLDCFYIIYRHLIKDTIKQY